MNTNVDTIYLQPVYLSYPMVVSAYNSGKIVDFAMHMYQQNLYAIVLAKTDITQNDRDSCTLAELDTLTHMMLIDIVNPRSLLSIRGMQIDSRLTTHITLGWDSLYIHYRERGISHHYYDSLCTTLPKYQWYSSINDKIDHSIKECTTDELAVRHKEAGGAITVNQRGKRVYIIDDTHTPPRYYVSVDAMVEDTTESMECEE